MARWINQVLKVSATAEIDIDEKFVWIGLPGKEHGAMFKPTNRDDANGMAIALRLAAKRLEDIGKGMN